VTSHPSLERYRAWLLAAGVYNLAWGSAVALAPRLFLAMLGIEPPSVIALWQVVGMMVLVYAPAYWWASRDPWAHRHLVLVGALGKILGTVGFIGAASLGQLPWSFGAIVLFNDVIWLPKLGGLLLEVARYSGWKALLSGS
jgi:small multidrug resistance pump